MSEDDSAPKAVVRKIEGKGDNYRTWRMWKVEVLDSEGRVCLSTLTTISKRAAKLIAREINRRIRKNRIWEPDWRQYAATASARYEIGEASRMMASTHLPQK